MRSKTLVILLIIAILSIFTPKQFAYAESSDDLTKQFNSTVIDEINKIDLSSFNSIIDELNANDSNIFSLDNIKAKIYSIISGESSISYENLIKTLFLGVSKTISKYLPILVTIIIIGIISNMISGANSKMFDKSSSNIIHMVCTIVVVGLLVASIGKLIETTGKSLTNMVSAINVIFPILLTLMATIGAGASAGTFQPIVAMISTYIGVVFKNFILPLFIFSFVINIVSNLSSSIKLDKFNSFISSLFKWAVGIVFTLFFAIFSIQGITAGSFDSISIRTTKFTVKSYVPIVGGYLSDGMDLILSSALLIKNAVGLIGVLVIISTIISPILEVVIFSLILKLASAILQPLGDSKISNLLSDTSKSIGILSTTIISVGFMFLISVGLIMSVSNLVNV